MNFCPYSLNNRFHGTGLLRIIENRVRPKALASIVGCNVQIDKGVFHSGNDLCRTYIAGNDVKGIREDLGTKPKVYYIGL